MKTIDRAAAKLLRQEIEAALATVAARHDVVVKLSNVRFDGNTFRGPIKVAVKRDDGLVENAHATNYRHLADLMGLPPNLLGQCVVLRGTVYRITGLNTRAPRMPKGNRT